MRFRQSLMKYSEKYGVKRAARKYNKSRSYIYFRKARWDGKVESLADKSKRPISKTVCLLRTEKAIAEMNQPAYQMRALNALL